MTPTKALKDIPKVEVKLEKHCHFTKMNPCEKETLNFFLFKCFSKDTLDYLKKQTLLN